MKFSDFESYAAAVDAVMNGGILDEAVQYRMSLEGREELEYAPIYNISKVFREGSILGQTKKE